MRYLEEKAARGAPYADYARHLRVCGDSACERRMAAWYAEWGATRHWQESMRQVVNGYRYEPLAAHELAELEALLAAL